MLAFPILIDCLEIGPLAIGCREQDSIENQLMITRTFRAGDSTI